MVPLSQRNTEILRRLQGTMNVKWNDPDAKSPRRAGDLVTNRWPFSDMARSRWREKNTLGTHTLTLTGCVYSTTCVTKDKLRSMFPSHAETVQVLNMHRSVFLTCEWTGGCCPLSSGVLVAGWASYWPACPLQRSPTVLHRVPLSSGLSSLQCELRPHRHLSSDQIPLLTCNCLESLLLWSLQHASGCYQHCLAPCFTRQLLDAETTANLHLCYYLSRCL